MLGQEPDHDGEAERMELQKVLDSVLQNVTSREERILRMYYGINFSRQFTLEEIGRDLKLTRERVRLIRDRSLRKLYRTTSEPNLATILIIPVCSYLPYYYCHFII